MLGAMREREFWQLLEEVFGRSYGRALAHDQGLTKLHGMTVVEALAAGEEPRVVWNVLCGQMDVPDAKRWGRDHNAPPLPVDFHEGCLGGRIRTNVRMRGYTEHIAKATASIACVCCI